MKNIFWWICALPKFMKTGSITRVTEKNGMENITKISWQFKSGKLYDCVLKSWRSILLLVFSFWIWSSRVMWIFCTLLRLALNERYRFANKDRLPISEILKTIDKNIIQNNRLFWTWYILPLKSSVSAFLNDPNKWNCAL